MALPPLVASGQVITATHINAIRNALGSLVAPIDAQGQNILNVGEFSASVVAGLIMTATSLVVTETALISGSVTVGGNAAITGNVTATAATLTGALTAASATLSGALSAAVVTCTNGVLNINAQNPAGSEGAEIVLKDYDNTGAWHLDNNDNSVRLFRGSAVHFRVSPTGMVGIGGAGTATPSFCRLTITDGNQDYTISSGGFAALKVGGFGQLDMGLFFGIKDGVGVDKYAHMQAVTPGDSVRTLLINCMGGGVVMNAPVTAAHNDVIPNNGFTFSVDEVNHRLWVTLRESSGVMRLGFLQLS